MIYIIVLHDEQRKYDILMNHNYETIHVKPKFERIILQIARRLFNKNNVIHGRRDTVNRKL